MAERQNGLPVQGRLNSGIYLFIQRVCMKYDIHSFLRLIGVATAVIYYQSKLLIARIVSDEFSSSAGSEFRTLQQWYRFTSFRRRKLSHSEQRLPLSDAENTEVLRLIWEFISFTRNGRGFWYRFIYLNSSRITMLINLLSKVTDLTNTDIQIFMIFLLNSSSIDHTFTIGITSEHRNKAGRTES